MSHQSQTAPTGRILPSLLVGPRDRVFDTRLEALPLLPSDCLSIYGWITESDQRCFSRRGSGKSQFGGIVLFQFWNVFYRIFKHSSASLNENGHTSRRVGDWASYMRLMISCPIARLGTFLCTAVCVRSRILIEQKGIRIYPNT